ncbi:tetratricopeptide repeat protein [Planctomycetes bacterium K23_9]|uniref:Photosystem I assembly protein Ycf3 n=1 Tax=Stieleria marina TaxID=1930275 RepID=A0A517P078_9BACT|nr:photosystem I assembly protein Ycf3 [Planctomycetes bacterium K23_9]
MSLRLSVLLCLFLFTHAKTWANKTSVDLIAKIKPQTIDLESGKVPHAALSDGVTSQAVEFALGGAPLDIIYDFGDQIVSPDAIVVHWSRTTNAEQAPTIEVLVSTLSADAGFQLLRTAHLRSQPGEQIFAFVPRTARWVMVRIIPAANAQHASLAELEIRGTTGPPESNYEFNESPADAFEVLSKLQGMIDLELSEDEKSLFQDAKDGTLDDWSLAEAVLIASGVTDRQQREPLLKKIDAHESVLRSQLNLSGDAFDNGKRLLQYLHTPPTLIKYELKQTDVHTLLNTGTFNCVSSAAMYNVLARRLNLDARIIEVPDHAFSILYDGSQHADVEATNRDGFNPSRNSAVLASFQRQTGFAYIADKYPDQRREIGETGLVGLIYYNHGVGHSQRKEFGNALVRYFCALSMDPEYDSAVKNTLVTLANWGASLAEEKKYQQSLSVLSAGVELAPKDAKLRSFRENVWKSRVFALMDADDSDQALAMLREAHQQVPDGGFDEMQSWVFIRPAQDRMSQKQWDAAIKLADKGLAAVDAPAKEQLTKWTGNVFLNWSVTAINDEQFDEAAEALHRGLKRFPKDYRLQRNVAFLAQKWSRQLVQIGKSTEATEMMADLMQRYPDNWSLKQVTIGSVSRQIQGHLKAGETEQAISLIDQNQAALSDQDVLKLKRRAYDLQADKFIQAKDWSSAVTAYKNALERVPGDYHLKNNLFAVYSTWCQGYIKTKNWSEAAKVCRLAVQDTSDFRLKKNHAYIVQEWLREISDKGPEAFDKVAREQIATNPQSRGVREVVENDYIRQIQKLLKAESYQDAVAVGVRGTATFKASQSRGIDRQFQRIYAVWAKSFIDNEAWQQASDVYEQGLKRYPKHRDFTNNLTVCWERRAKKFIDAKDWDAAIEVLEKAADRFPDNSNFKNNLRYCQAQKTKD